MKYLVIVSASVLVNAETSEEAIDEIGTVIREARKRNCGAVEDEIVSNSRVERVEIIEDDEDPE